MFEIEKIVNSINSRLRKFVIDVRLRPSDQAIMLYVPREKVSDKVKPGFTSYRQLDNLKQNLSKIFSREVEVVFVLLESHQGLEDAFGQMLNHKFTGKVMSFFMSFDDEKTVNAWIEISELSDELKDDIEKHYLNILKEADLVMGAIEWIDSSQDLPTYPWLLRFLKVHQPIKLKAFSDEIFSKFPSINEKWLSHKLDQLRKKGLIIRQQSGSYVLTSKALSIVPAGARSSSSDIDRILALGRRKW